MSGKFNMKKNVMAVVLALMMVSSVVIFASEPYSFTIALYAEDAYSTTVSKEVQAENAYVQQTGSSPGTYSVTYTVYATKYGRDPISNSQVYQSTDYTTTTIPYIFDYRVYTGPTVLGGHYNGTDYCTVTGRWNPNGIY